MLSAVVLWFIICNDILSPEHFSQTNRRIAVTLANRFASLVIANSQASKTAFVAVGGRPEITEVVYNGFDPKIYHSPESDISQIRQQLGIDGFVVGHFSRLAPWKGQHILIEALAQCPIDVTAIIVGDALFGEQDYGERLHQQVTALGLENRVKFLGFRSDIPLLMAACDLVAHTSTSPEPFGRVNCRGYAMWTPCSCSKSWRCDRISRTKYKWFSRYTRKSPRTCTSYYHLSQ